MFLVFVFAFLVFARCLDILAIAWKMVEGEVLYRKGLVGAGLESLREAARLDDALPYDEPWGWMQPARHALGALLLEQGRAAEAAEVHVVDLNFGVLSSICAIADRFEMVFSCFSYAFLQCLLVG